MTGSVLSLLVEAEAELLAAAVDEGPREVAPGFSGSDGFGVTLAGLSSSGLAVLPLSPGRPVAPALAEDSAGVALAPLVPDVLVLAPLVLPAAGLFVALAAADFDVVPLAPTDLDVPCVDAVFDAAAPVGRFLRVCEVPVPEAPVAPGARPAPPSVGLLSSSAIEFSM